MRKYQLLSNVDITNWLPEKVNIEYIRINRSNKIDRIRSALRLLRKCNSADAAIIFNPNIDEAIVAFLGKRIFRQKTLVIFFDALLHRPNSLGTKTKSLVKAILFNAVDKFCCVHKDTRGYQEFYSIAPEKFIYVPFKANNFCDRDKFDIKDGGYVLACGASHRDYGTFLKAVGRLGIQSKIVLPGKDTANFHNTAFPEKEVPSNVEVVAHDFDRTTWNHYIANARIVVIPIHKDVIQAAGISVCLEAMVLGKPVIITEGVSTRGLLTSKEAEIIPPSDPIALEMAISRLWNSPEYRERLAREGKRYALSLGGVERLVTDILNHSYQCLEQRYKSPSFHSR